LSTLFTSTLFRYTHTHTHTHTHTFTHIHTHTQITYLLTYVHYTACYKQISNFDGVISDCTAVLEVDPDNVKALIRRAQAFEGVERYRFALQDVKTVLMMGISSVGKTNYDLCNMMQHRLQRTVNQLKKMNSS
jgi:hypothetical protein